MPWNLTNDRPIYLQLIDHIKLQILSGTYNPGDSFPSVRELAAEAAVNPNTMQKALAALEQDGLLIGSRTSGRSVTTDRSLILDMRDSLAEQFYNRFHEQLLHLGYREEEVKKYLLKKLA